MRAYARTYISAQERKYISTFVRLSTRVRSSLREAAINETRCTYCGNIFLRRGKYVFQIIF